MTTPDAQPPAPQEQPPLQPPFAPPPPPAKSGGAGKRILIILGVLVVLCGGIGVAAYFATRNAPLNAKVGDCLHQKGENELAIVKCDTADADFEVLGKVGDKPQSEVNDPFTKVCDQWPDTTNTYWEGTEGKNGSALCLKKK
ncbi:LppU/SCO3897 family protein [Dactylosporangium darangshiense]